MEFERFAFPSRRSNVVARNGMVATSQPLAAQAGLRLLQAGGNAVDAALAAVATLCVVEPTSTGVGGDAFALIWSAAEKKLYGLNASGPAPAGLNAALIRDRGHDTMPTLGGLTVTVPGAVGGWAAALARFGTLPLAQILAPAINYAANGFPVSQRIARAWSRSTEKMSAQADSRRVWLPAPRAGSLFRNSEFAATLRLLAAEGQEAFYQGPVARQIAAAVQADGGVLTEADLAAYRPEWVTPIGVPYRDGCVFHEIPPNGQGLTALLALNIARRFDLRGMGFGSPGATHVQMEAIKLAFADAERYIGDPRQSPIPVAALLEDRYTDTRASLIDLQHALEPRPGDPSTIGDTVYLTVADEEGNMVSWIQSLYMGFGSGLTAGATGVQLQNRGANFVLDEGHPNQASPGRRPFHTIIPGFITRDGLAWASYGVMGGFMQPQGHLQVGVNLVDFGMDPQTALDAPRFNWQRDRLFALEAHAPDALRQALVARGHAILPVGTPMHYGGGQVIVRDPASGVLIAGSEPRNDGQAVGW